MVLLAIILIGAGLACLGFVGYSLMKGGLPEPRVAATPGQANGPAAGGSGAHPGAAAPTGTPTTAASPRFAPEQHFAGRPAGEELAHAIGAPAAAPSASAASGASRSAVPEVGGGEGEPPAIGLDLRERSELNFLRDRLTGLQRIDTDSLNESLRVMEKTERATADAAPQLIVSGVLFLDHGRKIPAQMGRRGEIPTRIFSELRRVGNGTLILEGSSFLIHCGNTSYSYSAGDMDQILFQGGGLALVPIHPDRPIPLFLTTEVAAVKAYIKKNARIRSL